MLLQTKCVQYNKSEHLKKKREGLKKKHMHYIPTSWTGKLDAMGITKNRCKETERRRRKKTKKEKRQKTKKTKRDVETHQRKREQRERAELD